MISLEERIGKLELLLRNMENSIKSGMRVALPAKVTSFDPEKQTISCIPTVRELININGKAKFVTLPELRDVPINIPRGGGWSITLPIKVGQECMVVFQDLCIDGWWFRGDIQNWNDLRRHDLSDAIAIFSPYSQPNVLSSYNTDGLEIRSDDGKTKMTFTPDGVTMTCPKGLNISGDISVDGKIESTGDIISDNISLQQHTHLYNPGPGDPTSTGVPQ